MKAKIYSNPVAIPSEANPSLASNADLKEIESNISVLFEKIENLDNKMNDDNFANKNATQARLDTL